MAGKIKGITIEIGADSSPLNKALRSINTEIKSTQTSLREVNKYLKLDPTNTELLRQKHKLLGDELKLNRDKLEKLKEAAEKAAQSSGNWDAWEEGSKKFQKEIDASIKKQKELEKALEAMETAGEIDTDQYKALQKELEETKKHTTDLKKEQSDLYKELGQPISTEEMESLQRELIGTEQQVQKLKKAFQDSEPSLARFAAVSGEVAEKTAVISKVAAGGAAAMLGNAYKAALAADDYNTLSKQLNISVEDLQKFKYAADLIDVPFDTLTGSFNKLTKAMGSGSDAFKTLGVNLKDSQGNFRDADEVFYDTVQALSKIENETERDILAQELFGKTSRDLTGIIDDGGEALRAYGDQAEKNGLILSGDALNAANEFNDAIDELKATTSAAFLKAGAALSTTLVPALERLVGVISEVLIWFSNLSGETQGVILAVLGIVAAISPLAAAFSKINTIVSGFSSALTFFSNPAGIAIAAIAALIIAGVALYENWDKIKEYAAKLLESLKNTWEKIKNNTIAVYTGIKDGLVAIWNGITNTVSSAIRALINIITSAWNTVKNTTINVWNGIKNAIASVVNGMRAAISSGLNAIASTAANIWNGIKNTASSVWNGIKSTISGYIRSIRNLFNFSWSLPSPRVPHFYVSWRDVGWGLKLPSISWYAKGGILDGAQIFGKMGNSLLGGGEAGKEAVLPLDSFYRELRNILTGSGAQQTINNVITVNANINNATDIDNLADTIANRIQFAVNRKEAAWR